jgi:hypothetical protein
MVRSNNHCCSGKALSVAYSECVFVAFGIKREIPIRHIVICGMSGPIILVQIVLQMKRSSKKVLYIKLCSDFLYYVYLKHFSFYEELCEI